MGSGKALIFEGVIAEAEAQIVDVLAEHQNWAAWIGVSGLEDTGSASDWLGRLAENTLD